MSAAPESAPIRSATLAATSAASAAPCPPSEGVGRIFTVRCAKGEPDDACRQRAEGQVPAGSKWLATLPGTSSSGYVAKVSVDGVVETWTEPDIPAVTARAQALAAQGRNIVLLGGEAVKISGGREMKVMVLEPPAAVPAACVAGGG